MLHLYLMPRKYSYIRYLLLLWLITGVVACKEKHTSSKSGIIPLSPPSYLLSPDTIKLRKQARLLREYAQAHGYNMQLAFLVDFSVFSGSKRFICYDLEHQRVLSSALVSHGQGPDFRAEKVVFSNVPGSRCSSLGKYRIGVRYSGQFGTAYKLHGLDSTNSNAFNRFVVLHSYRAVPAVAQEQGICRSDGCPMLNPAYFASLEPYIDRANRPILLWIYR
ncbi:L,D-transpeptidase-like protein [Chitinophaga polysaccharea]|uniref:L,D-transpeptidase-like protein n=2 Tax=Chitinophaga polysaccharea TaxID=1293035 RepID=A0A561PXD2_9BACT|nr:L,D-transpeptidase-like protein [Chitinophaga polysaccharea]